MTPHQRVEILRAACCVAGSDGELDPAECKIIDCLAGEIGCGTASVNAMIGRGQSDPNFFQMQFRILNESRQESMIALIEVAMADGRLVDKEALVFRGLANNLKIPGPDFDELLARVSRGLDSRGGN